MMKPRKILFVTGTRADFGKLKPLIRQVQQAPEFEYAIFATGMHMLSRYGSTIIEIQKAGFDQLFSFINQDGAINSQMDIVLANTIQGLGHYIREFPPDLIVVHGDRLEALAGAIVGALNNTLVAHVEGGELSGTVDELIRHSVSKLSHLHFVANEEARRRLVQMGEAPDRVFVIGSPDIDVMLSEELPSLAQVREKYEIPFAQYGIFIYHPVTTELAALPGNVDRVVSALVDSGRNYVVIYPNNDVGSHVIMARIEPLQGQPRFRVLPSMRFEYFLTLLKHAQVIVGNSSAGVREAPVFCVPTVNLGTRQRNRVRGDSIVNVPESRDAILKALAALPAALQPSTHFGKGDSAVRFLACIRTEALWQTPRQKQFLDLALAE